MKLTKHFTLEELTRSDVAVRKGIDNTPPGFVIENLRRLADRLETLRALLDAPIIVSSGYRCPILNHAIGGSRTSAHTSGLAADFIAPDFGTPLEIARVIERHADALDYDQLIYEGAWVHIGFTLVSFSRREVLTAHFGEDGKVRYTEGLA